MCLTEAQFLLFLRTQIFDTLMVFSKGALVYFGPVRQALPYFEALVRSRLRFTFHLLSSSDILLSLT